MSDDITIEEEIRRRRHANAQRKTDTERKSMHRPRQDDFNRAAYYALLRVVRECEICGKPEAADKLRLTVLQILNEAGFAPDSSSMLFEDHLETAERNCRAWIVKRQADLEKASRSAADL